MEAKSALLLGLLSVLGIAVTAETNDDFSQTELPAFCGKNDCPKYQLVKQYDTFEQRQYEQTRWVTTSQKQDIFGIGMVISFRRLFKYISGENDKEMKINMTVPVIMRVPLKEDSAVNATMSFFVPHEVQNPPIPTNPDVYLETLPTVSMFVKTFGEYALHKEFEKKAKSLAEELRTLGLQFDDTLFYRVGYNDPFTFFDRHNEVWYIAK